MKFTFAEGDVEGAASGVVVASQRHVHQAGVEANVCLRVRQDPKVAPRCHLQISTSQIDRHTLLHTHTHTHTQYIHTQRETHTHRLYIYCNITQNT